MPHPQGMRRDDYSRICFQVAAVLFCALLAFCVVFMATTPAKAQGMKCAPYAAIEKSLTGPKYKEVKVATGLSGMRQTIVFVSPDTRTFTFVVRLPNGLGCILGGGTDWKFHKPPKQKLKQS